MPLRPLVSLLLRLVSAQTVPWRIILLTSYTCWLLASTRLLKLDDRRLIDIAGISPGLLFCATVPLAFISLFAEPHSVATGLASTLALLLSALVAAVLLVQTAFSPSESTAGIFCAAWVLAWTAFQQTSKRITLIIAILLLSVFRYSLTWDRVVFEASLPQKMVAAASLPILAGFAALVLQRMASAKLKLYHALPSLVALTTTLAALFFYKYSLPATRRFEPRVLLAVPWIAFIAISAIATCLLEGALSLLLSGLACHLVADVVDVVALQQPWRPVPFVCLALGLVVLSDYQTRPVKPTELVPDVPSETPWLHRVLAILGVLAVLAASSRPRAVMADYPSLQRPFAVQVAQAQLNYTKVASMIETRASPILLPLLTHWLVTMPPDWPFVIWVSPASQAQIQSSAVMVQAMQSGRLNLTRLPDWVDVGGGEQLSRFLTKPWFWHAHDSRAEWMLFFQSDALLCAASEQTPDDWLGYDYVGAPCPWSTHNERHGGNGGLSMRKISTMQRITDDRRPEIVRQDVTSSNWRSLHGTPHEAEDWWIMSRIEMLVSDARWPEDRSQNIFSLSWGGQDAMRPLGVHRGSGQGLGVWQRERAQDFQKLISYCPELLLIRDYATGRIPDPA